jgi:hypothetical protein
VVDFELFRAEAASMGKASSNLRVTLERAVPRSDRAKGGRPPFDHVLMFETLILQANHNLSDERTEYLIRDRLSFMRFPRSRACRHGAGRQDDLDLPRSADAGPGSRANRRSRLCSSASTRRWRRPGFWR